MPRAPGQIDRAKNEAILDAAAEILGEKGLSAPMALIARRANVSKQTIYNHYGAKMDLIQALVQRRVEAMTQPLVEPETPTDPVDALATFAATLIRFVVAPNGANIMRLTIQSSTDTPKLAHDVMVAGPLATIERLSRFMKAEMKAGRMAEGDPAEAAEMFAGMAAGHKQTLALLGYPMVMEEKQIQAQARRLAERFQRAYAV
jgi:AcrR family transcriptional regulator